MFVSVSFASLCNRFLLEFLFVVLPRELFEFVVGVFLVPIAVSADSRSELCGTDTLHLRCIGCLGTFFSLVFRIGFEAPIRPPLVDCLVFQ